MTENINIFQVEYSWHEGEHQEILLGKPVEREEFENDLLKAKEFAESLMGIEIQDQDYLGKGYHVDCLPEYYEQIIWFLTEKLGYTCCDFDKGISYDIDDPETKKIGVTKSEIKKERAELKPA